MRIIVHLDMDAFFAAIEERDNPRFQGLPIVVGADPKDGRGRGVVSTANYKAREYGIHSAMPISRAWQLTQKAVREGKVTAIFLPVNGRHYSEVSRRIMFLIRGFAPKVEEASIDEAYLDVSFTGTFEKARQMAVRIKEAISRQEKLTASVGIGPNKLIAKIASSKNKPDGLTVVEPKQVSRFLKPLSIREIPGIGPKTEAMLNKGKIFTISDLRKLAESELERHLGKWGIALYRKVRGIDFSEVTEENEIKSVGEQETFDQDTLNSVYISERLSEIASQVIRRMGQYGFSGFRTLTIVVRFADFQTKTRSLTLKKSTNDLVTLKREALKLLLPFWDKRENPRMKLVRLVGLRIEKLSV